MKEYDYRFIDVPNVKTIEVEARAGAAIYNCIREAVILAAERKIDVVLIHNDIRYDIKADDIYSIAKKRG